MDILKLQRSFEALYSIPLPVSITDFLVTDARLVRELIGETEFSSQERLLIHQDSDHIDLSLYIDQSVLEHLSSDDPLKHVHNGNLTDYLVTLEGVSHFVCAAWHAKEDRCITLMELELQGEIDKFVALAITLIDQGHRNLPASLRRQLFGNFELATGMSRSTRTRYRDANNLARRYCRHLHKSYLGSMRSHRTRRDLKAELSRFYRLDQTNKIHAIERVTA